MSRVNALIIDDSETDRYLIRRILRRCEAIRNVEEFSNGEEALSFIRDAEEYDRRCGPNPPPALAFLDINMPRMSGFDVLQAIQDLGDSGTFDTSKRCLVIMLTSSNYSGDREKSLAYGFVAGYLEKPLDREELQDILSRHYPDTTPAN